jgi:hypothetical protein
LHLYSIRNKFSGKKCLSVSVFYIFFAEKREKSLPNKKFYLPLQPIFEKNNIQNMVLFFDVMEKDIRGKDRLRLCE